MMASQAHPFRENGRRRRSYEFGRHERKLVTVPTYDCSLLSTLQQNFQKRGRLGSLPAKSNAEPRDQVSAHGPKDISICLDTRRSCITVCLPITSHITGTMLCFIPCFSLFMPDQLLAPSFPCVRVAQIGSCFADTGYPSRRKATRASPCALDFSVPLNLPFLRPSPRELD